MSNKHYTFSKEVLYILANRDKEKYPKEAALIQDALIHHAYNSEIKDLQNDIRYLGKQIERLCRIQEMNIRIDAKAGKYFNDYPGGMETIEEVLHSYEEGKSYQLPSDKNKKEF